MNAPFDGLGLTHDAHDITLDDKWTLERGRVFMTSTQALIRLPMLQRERDVLAGLNTAGYISGYQQITGVAGANLASPLGRYHVV